MAGVFDIAQADPGPVLKCKTQDEEDEHEVDQHKTTCWAKVQLLVVRQKLSLRLCFGRLLRGTSRVHHPEIDDSKSTCP